MLESGIMQGSAARNSLGTVQYPQCTLSQQAYLAPEPHISNDQSMDSPWLEIKNPSGSGPN